MSQPAKTTEEIAKETFEFYEADPNRRCSNGSQCFYELNGRNCAVGRCMIDPSEYSKTATDLTNSVGVSVRLDDTLKEEYRGHSVYFWRCLQFWHDSAFTESMKAKILESVSNPQTDWCYVYNNRRCL